jgi:RHS repeat-associated protein
MTESQTAVGHYGIPAPGNVGRFGYTGQTWLPEVKLWHYKARMYSPTLGRFLSTDPIGYGDGMNWYNYVGGDPVNFVDPLGLARFEGDDDEIVVEGRHFCDTVPGKYDAGCHDGGTIPGMPDVPVEIVVCSGVWTLAGDCVKPQSGQRKNDPGCERAMSEGGTIVYSGGTGTLIVGGGITGSWGTFTNQNRGSYFSIGGGGGADIGGGAQLGYARNIRLFIGGSVSGSASAFGAGGSANGSLSNQGVTYSGLSGSVAPGPWKFGASVTAAGTKIYSCSVVSN